MAATVSNRKILNLNKTADGGLMALSRRGENADSEISSDVRSKERFIDKYVPRCRAFANSEENKDDGGKDRKPDYFHVSKPRGQATDIQSLSESERVLREEIGERMKYLQDLVPGCSKTVGNVEIINKLQSLDRQVEKIQNEYKIFFGTAFDDRMRYFTRGENPCPEIRFYPCPEISFDVRSKFTNKCLPHEFAISEENENNDKAVKFYSRQGTGSWGSLKLVHPATLEELGPENKGIISDLLRFVMEKEFYKKEGKAWTGFYSLYEPPGTDRLSLIGAMANYLEFDIYNLDLTSLPSIEELKKMLGSIRNRSLIAIQDFNHWPGMLSKFKTELTVPCLLKIFYHLFSSCGDEHIVVFTTQHRDRHNAALLHRFGTDMHIYAPLALPEEDDEIVEGGERVKVYSGLLQAKPDKESADLGIEIEEGKGEKNLEEGMLEISKELCQEAEEEENQEFEVEEGNQEFTDPEKLETQDALLIQEREEEAKVEDRRERADNFMRTLGRCEKLNSEISLIQQYLAHASAHSKKNEDNDKSSVKVYRKRGRGCWDSMKLEHLATLEELGMDPENKGEISDLLGFVRMKEFYKKEGKAWKKGYLLNEPEDETHFVSGKWVEIQWNLFSFVRNKEFYKTKGDTWKRVYWLYEPPDTDRSSLSAATANYLKLYTCDLDLTSIPSKLELKDTLLSSRERSSIVIKDSDFKNESTISLSDGEHILSLSEKKIVRKTLKRKCRSMSILSLEDHKQHVDRRWEDAAKSHGAKRICRQLVIHRLSTAKRIRRQHGIHRRPFQRSAVGLPDGGHILPLSEKKIVTKTLKRKCRSMNVLSLVDRQQYVDRRWEDAAKNIGAKRICRQLVIHCVSIVKHRQRGIHHRWPFQQDWATEKGYSLGDERPVEVICISTHAELVSRLQLIYISWLGRFSPQPSALPRGGLIVGPIALSSSACAATNNVAQRVGQDQRGSGASGSENERTREQEDPRQDQRGSGASGSENERTRKQKDPKAKCTSITKDDLLQLPYRMTVHDAAAYLKVSKSTVKRKWGECNMGPWNKRVWKPPDQHGEGNTSTARETPSHNMQTGMEGEPIGQNQEANESQRDFMGRQIALNPESGLIMVSRPPDRHGERNTSTARETPSHNVQTGIEGVPVGQNQEANEFRPDFTEGSIPWNTENCLIIGSSFGRATQVNDQSILSTPYPNHDAFGFPLPQTTSMPSENMGGSIDLRNSLASHVVSDGHISGSTNSSFATCSVQVGPSQHVQGQSMHPTVYPDHNVFPRTQIVSSQEPLSEGHVFGFGNGNEHTNFVMIKAFYRDGDNTIFKFLFPLTSGIVDLKKEVSKRLNVEVDRFVVKYKDKYEDLISILCNEDLMLYLLSSLGNDEIKVLVLDKVGGTPNFCEKCRSSMQTRE